MKRKILSLFLCSMVLTGGLVGCSTDKSTVDTSLPSSTVEETTDQVAETEYKTMDPPEEGWTIEELLSVTYLYGEQLSYPITLNSLPDVVKSEDFNPNKAGDTIVSLYHDDNKIGFGVYYKISKNEINKDTPFNAISFNNDSKMVINGKKLGEEYGDMNDYLGEPAEETDHNENTTFYKTKDDVFRINVGNSDNVFSIFALRDIPNAKTNKE